MKRLLSKLMKMHHNLSMQNKLILVLVIISSLSLSVPVLIYNAKIKNILMERFENIMEKNYKLVSGSIKEQLNRTEEMAKMLSINNTLEEVLGSGGKLELNKEIKYFNEISSLFDTITDSTNIEKLMLYIDDGYSMAGTSPGTRFRSLNLMKTEGWGEVFNKNYSRKCWNVWREKSPFDKTAYLTYFQALWDEADYRKMVGVLALGINTQILETLLVSNYDEQVICLYSDEGLLLSNAAGYDADFSGEELFVTGDLLEEIKINGKEYMYLYTEISSNGIYLLSACPKEVITKENSEMLLYITRIMLFSIVVVAALIFAVSASLSRRFKVLLKGMNRVYEGELAELPDEHYQDEIGRLTTGYNYMIESINQLMKEQKKLGAEMKSTELLALQSQINPHFLYNTLDMINWMALKAQTENIRDTVRLLSRYYKLSLSKGQDIVTIEQELHLCITYLEIQFLRFRGKIKFMEQVEDTIKKFMMPKIILQPIVENAIFYGINTKPEGRGTIWLNGRLEDGGIILEIIDDGMGYDTTQPYNQKSVGSHYGLLNIKKRLEMYYGKEDCLNIASTPGIGTKVTITVPAILP